MSFADKTITCRDCGEAFTFTAGEQGDFGAEDAFELELAGSLGEPDRAAQVVVVGEGQGRHA